jgi:A/G-specific adenine glycosylase
MTPKRPRGTSAETSSPSRAAKDRSSKATPTKPRRPPVEKSESPAAATKPAESPAPTVEPPTHDINPASFRRRLISWYRAHARDLPWRGTADPYRIWVSEIMLQQTRVAAVIDHYNQFIRRFPTLVSLALAPESDVLAAWSGLGYYRRARMLHKAARFIMLERDARIPPSSAELRTLPGIGDYTAAAIASIAFGEAVAVLDGNVERVILRLTGRTSSAPDSSQTRAFIRAQAQALMPHARLLSSHLDAHFVSDAPSTAPTPSVWDASERLAIAASAHPTARAGGEAPVPHLASNPAGDHNQAMMELGATLCLPRNPLCLQCPVYALCRTRGEHLTPARAPQRSLPVAFLLDLRKRGPATEVLLERRPDDASLMPSMYELPPLPLEAVDGREPVLRVRHAITNTNYYVQIFAPIGIQPSGAESTGTAPLSPTKPIPASRTRAESFALRRAIPAAAKDLHWVRTSRLASLPLTGLARKVLQRLRVMDNPRIPLLE